MYFLDMIRRCTVRWSVFTLFGWVRYVSYSHTQSFLLRNSVDRHCVCWIHRTTANKMVWKYIVWLCSVFWWGGYTKFLLFLVHLKFRIVFGSFILVHSFNKKTGFVLKKVLKKSLSFNKICNLLLVKNMLFNYFQQSYGVIG